MTGLGDRQLRLNEVIRERPDLIELCLYKKRKTPELTLSVCAQIGGCMSTQLGGIVCRLRREASEDTSPAGT